MSQSPEWMILSEISPYISYIIIYGYFGLNPSLISWVVQRLECEQSAVKTGLEMTFSALCLKPGVRFSKTPESFRARKAIFSSSVFKDREEYTPENSCMKRTSVSIKNI